MAQQLTPDCAAWLPVADRVLAGDYRDCDETTRESLSIGLRGIEHDRCRAAMVRLWPKGVPEKHSRSWVRKENEDLG